MLFWGARCWRTLTSRMGLVAHAQYGRQMTPKVCFALSDVDHWHTDGADDVNVC